jgi:plasmid stabilization system protein ParE
MRPLASYMKTIGRNYKRIGRVGHIYVRRRRVGRIRILRVLGAAVGCEG